MRIAYVTIHVAPEIMQGGVGKKIKSQITIWAEEGHDVALFSLTPAETPIVEARQFVFDSKAKLIQREINRAKTLVQMLASIREYKPDLIYLRFGLYSYPLHRLFTIAPVVLETNSDDMQEYIKRGKFLYWTNRLTRNLTFGPARGLITPSHELVDILLPDHDKPVCVISNGIDLKDTSPLPATKNTTPVITLVGSPGMKWHGVDKLIQFAEICPDVVINIVGYSEKDIDGPIPANVHLHGFLSREQVREVLMNTDVACGSLALHRNNMQEASVLKIREALAYGIPVIVAYRDTDLDGIRTGGIFQIPNTETNMIDSAENIRKFAYSMMGKRVNLSAVTSLLDQRRKEITRLNFFKLMLEKNS